MRALGADVIEHGTDFQAAREHAAQLAERDPALELVPAFHPDLVLGVATYAYELFTQAPDLDTVYVPVGMGSGISALIAVRDLLDLPTEIVGVVTARADATARSFAAGRVVSTETADTFVDGVATRVPDAGAIAGIVAGAARIVTVSEDAAAEAMRLVFRTTHNVAEPAGALAAAGLAAESEHIRGRRVAMVLSGGNVDTAMLAEVLSGRTPAA
jgi:threonine dehydratase